MKKLLVMILTLALAVPAFAMRFDTGNGTIDVYGSLRHMLVYEMADDGDDSASRLRNELQGNSRFGFRWVKDDVFMNFEADFGGTKATAGAPAAYAGSANNLRLRLFHAGYKVNGGEGGTFRFGQMVSLTHTDTYYGQRFNGDNGLAGFGTIRNQRQPGIAYEIGGDWGKFNIAAFTSRANSVDDMFVNYEEMIPKIDVAYDLPLDFFFRIGASYMQLAAQDDTNEDISAYHVALVARPEFGNMYVLASGFYGSNAGLYSMATQPNLIAAHKDGGFRGYGDGAAPLRNADDAVTTFGVALGFGMKLDSGTFELGFGYQSSDWEKWENTLDNAAVYVNYAHRVVPGFTITPEIGYYMINMSDALDADVDTQTVIQAGVQFRLDI